MKRLRSILITITSIVMMCMYILPVKAAYSYKVTILAGLHGKVNGQDKVEITVAPGAFWYPKDYTVTVDDPRFYFKGFQESGIEDYGRGGAQAITKDTVFVARYGIAGKTVEYTVRYVDAAGNPLIAADTFYGNVGDKPVVSYRYIPGFVPNANNMTKTLSENKVDNVFTFTYVPGEAIVVEGEGGTTGIAGYTYTDGGTQVVYLPGQNAGGQNAAGNANAGGQNAAPANQQNAADANAGQNAGGAADQPAQGPTELVDLDDTDVPLANVTSPAPQATPGTEIVNPKPGLNFFWIAAMILSGFGIIALIAILIMLMRRKREESLQE